ncbi:F0F1 ATP synthase subunit B [Ruania halotolerans]|uniref:F0F1 ATP synthase subunit B n=1 Tax=Ruania halotolerans TaxID=2897773 RepID=UPI001E60CE01|nr:F0F1 ATP synthase subunit B [Ruania halotolerans]UFU07653.1 F0F1 ATP synthase subunit B [Ruania halotolerans]
MITAHETPNPLLPAGYDIVWSLVVTVVIAIFFFKYLLPKLNAILDERAAKIEGGLQLAEKAQAEAAEAKTQVERELVAARKEAAGIREEAVNDGSQILAESKAKAQAEATRIAENAQRQIEAERQSAIVSLRSEVGTLATELASRIVGESLADDARQSRVVDRFLSELDGTMNAPAGASASSSTGASAEASVPSSTSTSAEASAQPEA